MKDGIEYPKSRIHRHLDKQAVSLEQHLRQMLAGKEPIDLGAKFEYTDRKDGVLPQYDIRTDRYELARKAADKVSMSQLARSWGAEGYQKDENGNWIKPEGEA